MKIKGNRIIVTFIAGEDLSEGDVVYVSGANTVSKATASNANKVVGVVDSAASAGEEVDVVIYGIKKVTADGAISAGDPVTVASTAGRVATESHLVAGGHTHTENLDASYTQNATTGTTPPRIGIALGSAGGAGDTLDILVCLG